MCFMKCPTCGSCLRGTSETLDTRAGKYYEMELITVAPTGSVLERSE